MKIEDPVDFLTTPSNPLKKEFESDFASMFLQHIQLQNQHWLSLQTRVPEYM